MGKRRVFSAEFKRAAVKATKGRGKSTVQVAKELELDENLLHKWKAAVRKAGQNAFPGKGRRAGVAADLHRLEAENRRLRIERDILKKARPSDCAERPTSSPLSIATARPGPQRRSARPWE